jgi:hypothetical protein
LTLREEHRLRVFESRVLWKIFGPKRETREWRKLHNQELRDLYTSSKEDEMGGSCSTYGGEEERV